MTNIEHIISKTPKSLGVLTDIEYSVIDTQGLIKYKTVLFFEKMTAWFEKCEEDSWRLVNAKSSCYDCDPIEKLLDWRFLDRLLKSQHEAKTFLISRRNVLS